MKKVKLLKHKIKSRFKYRGVAESPIIGTFKDEFYYVNGIKYYVFKINPSVNISVLNSGEINLYYNFLRKMYREMGIIGNYHIYKYNYCSSVKESKSSDNEIISIYLNKRSEDIQKTSNLNVPSYFLLFQENEKIDVTKRIFEIFKSSYCDVSLLDEYDEMLFESVVNFEIDKTDATIWDGELLDQGCRYSCFVELINLKQTEQQFAYLNNILNEEIDYKMQVVTSDIKKVKKNISNSISDLNSRIDRCKNAVKKKVMEKDLQSLEYLSASVSNPNSSVYDVRIIFCFQDFDKDNLLKRVDDFIYSYEEDFQLKKIIFENPTKFWMAGSNNFDFYDYPVSVKPKKLTTEMLAFGGIFDFKDLVDDDGLYLYGTSRGRLIVDFAKTSKAQGRLANSMLVSGTTGSGKSSFLKQMCLHLLSNGHSIDNIDVNGDFVLLTKSLGGLNIDVSNDIKINPLEVYGWDLFENKQSALSNHISFVKGFFTTALNSENTSLNSTDLVMLDLLLGEFYDSWGVHSDMKSYEYPIFEDFYHYIAQINNPSNEKIMLFVKYFVAGSMGTYFNHHSVDVENKGVKFVNYHIAKLSEDMQNLMLFVIFAKFKNRMIANKSLNDIRIKNNLKLEFKFLLIDECQKILKNPSGMDFASGTTKEARKFYSAIIYATQAIHEFDDADALFGQLVYQIFLKQAPDHIPKISDKMNVPIELLEDLSLKEPGEGIMILNSKIYPIEFEIDEYLIKNIFDGGHLGK